MKPIQVGLLGIGTVGSGVFKQVVVPLLVNGMYSRAWFAGSALSSGSIGSLPATPELLRACVGVLAGWGWSQRPAGIVAMPSRSHPQLVQSLAHGLAEIGRLPLLGTGKVDRSALVELA